MLAHIFFLDDQIRQTRIHPQSNLTMLAHMSFEKHHLNLLSHQTISCLRFMISFTMSR